MYNNSIHVYEYYIYVRRVRCIHKLYYIIYVYCYGAQLYKETDDTLTVYIRYVRLRHHLYCRYNNIYLYNMMEIDKCQ